MEISKSLQNICFMERFLISLMEKKTKTEGKFKNGKNLKKEDICFRWELNSRHFGMTEVGNYLENRSNEKKYLLSLRVELKIFHKGKGG